MTDTDVGTGEEPTEEDLAWDKFAERFTPDKQMEFLDAKAERLVSQISVVGTVLGAAGLVAVASVMSDAEARRWAVGSIAVAGLSVFLALLTQVRWPGSLRAGNLIELKKWFVRYATWRGWCLALASLLLVGAFTLAAVAVGVALSAETPAPSVGVKLVAVPGEDDGSATSTLTVAASLSPQDQSDVASVIARVGDEVVGTATQGVGADSKITISLEVKGLARDATVMVELSSSGWSCESSGSVVEPVSTKCAQLADD